MKVIQRNEKHAPKMWKGRCHCGNCASVLEVEESDLDHYQGYSQRGNESWNYAIFRCPCCSENNSVDVPKTVLNRLTVKGDSPGDSFHHAKLVTMRGTR
jgi:hypothetical protein